MFDFLFPSARSRDAYSVLEAGSSENLPSTPSRNSQPTSQPSRTRLQLDTSMIGAPMLSAAPQSLTGFDDVDGRWMPPEHRPSNSSPRSFPSPSKSSSSSRSGPSAIAWLRPQPQSPVSSENGEQPGVLSAPTRVALRNRHLHTMDRSLSSPAASSSTTTTPISPSPPSSSSPSSQRSARPTPLPSHSKSMHSLRLDAQSQSAYVTGNMNAYNGVYPKPLSPIQELEYLSPESPRRTIPLPSVQDTTVPSPSGSKRSKGSDSSDMTIRPSPIHSTNPFISRTPKRSLSQSSSRSASSSIAPSIPPLDLRPPFPGPHASPSSDPPLRPPKSSALHLQTQLPTIESSGNSEEYEVTPTEGEYSRASAHADSFVTASESSPHPLRAGTMPFAEPQITEEDRVHYPDDDDEDDIGVAIPVAYPIGEHPVEYNDAVGALLQSSDSNTALSGNPSSTHRLSTPLSTHRHLAATPTPTLGFIPPSYTAASTSQSQSTSESFLDRRWERDAGFSAGSALGSVRFKSPKREWVYLTPAFWAFWLGFICPALWLVGGWHFTRYGEMPPMKTVWEFYFVVRMPFGKKEWWGERFGWCLGSRKRKVVGNGKEKENEDPNAREASEKGKANGIPPGGGVIGNPVGDVDLEKGNSRHPGPSKRQQQQQQLPPLPRWIREKQSTESKIFKRSLRGISFGYPFIPRPPLISPSPLSSSEPSTKEKCWQMFMDIITKPNRVFDMFPVVKLRDVRGKGESRRRMFDPWIQRCRYAFCYAVLLFLAALATVSTFLIVYNTRTLR